MRLRKEASSKGEQGRMRSKKRKRSRSSESPSKDSSSDDSDFQDARRVGLAPQVKKGSARAGKKVSAGLEVMSGFLPSHGLGDNARYPMCIATTYLVSILSPSLSSDLKKGAEREMRTLAESMHLILEGFVPEGLDILMSRFQANESSMSIGWSSSQHLELIPRTQVSSVQFRTSFDTRRFTERPMR